MSAKCCVLDVSVNMIYFDYYAAFKNGVFYSNGIRMKSKFPECVEIRANPYKIERILTNENCVKLHINCTLSKQVKKVAKIKFLRNERWDVEINDDFIEVCLIQF